MIELQQALTEMERKDRKGNALPFTIEFVTADLNRDKGGEIKTLTNAVLVTPAHWRKKRMSTGATRQEKKAGPNHFDNMTRNIRQLNDTAIVKIHIWLITKFNNEKVAWNILG